MMNLAIAKDMDNEVVDMFEGSTSKCGRRQKCSSVACHTGINFSALFYVNAFTTIELRRQAPQRFSHACNERTSAGVWASFRRGARYTYFDNF